MTPVEYLAFERNANERHEYIDGEVFAMSGGTGEHALIGANMVALLSAALLERPCRVYGSDMKIGTAAPKYHYPDVSVVCGSPAYEDERRDVLKDPVLLVEVLSDSTERYDRGDKFASYRTIASLREYVLCSQTGILVEHFHRQSDGTWLYRTFGSGERFSLPSLGCEISVDQLYRKVFSEV